MKFKLKNNIWKSDESSLGFYCINIYDSSKPCPDLSEMLSNRILKEREFGKISFKSKLFKKSHDHYGSFLLDKINVFDFKQLSFKEFEFEINNFCKKLNWGNDLIIFKKNFENVISYLKGYKIERKKIHMLNMDDLESTKLTEDNFFTYLVCVILTEYESEQIIIVTFGGD